MSDSDRAQLDTTTLLDLTTRIVRAYARNTILSVAELVQVIDKVSRALGALGNKPDVPVAPPLFPAVPIKKSVSPDFLICLEDGKKFKMMKRHLMRQYGLSPADYRIKWGLPGDYPMVASNYAATRSRLAKSFGLGNAPARVRPGEPVAKRGRPRKPPESAAGGETAPQRFFRYQPDGWQIPFRLGGRRRGGTPWSPTEDRGPMVPSPRNVISQSSGRSQRPLTASSRTQSDRSRAWHRG